ncbi:MAG TPA: hypothetical protein VMT85_15605 [Thermoanaerobaculia bacterium]|nr:hypothetical protein [Thermoanaerobaculia bacterium]
MKRLWLWALAGAIALLAILLITTSSTGATSSALGRGSLGWRGLERLLDSRGIESALLDRALEHRDPILERPEAPGAPTPAPATLVLGFPWQRGGLGWDPAPVLGFVRRGGRLVLATSSGATPSVAERRLIDALGVEWEAQPRAGALRPLSWWRQRRRGERWAASDNAPFTAPLVTGSLGGIARPPRESDATVLAVDGEGAPVAAVFEVEEGEVWLLPSQVLANAYLGEPGNASLALVLADNVSGPLLFDEFHHGLISAEAQLAEPAGRAFDAAIVQLGLLWGLAVLAFAWRFGPAWPTPVQLVDAHRSFLVGLGALHHRLGHERQAAGALVRRMAAYDPSLVPPDQVETMLRHAETAPLLELARELCRPPRPRELRSRGARSRELQTGEQR